MKKYFPAWTFPVAALILCILAFGLLIPRLGFYWDDWPVIVTTRLQGVTAFWDFYRLERPFSAWTYILSAPVLGTSPFGWHIFTLLLRWLAVLAMWWCLRGIWPKHTREATWAALIFAIYPVFTQQPVAVAFSQHWITFALYFLSMGAMIQAVRSPHWFWPLSLLGWAAAAVHIFTMEYFLGLELLRPIVLWMILGEEGRQGKSHRMGQVLKIWLPYLLIFVAFVIWRLFFLIIPKDPNNPDLLYSLASQPLGTLVRLLQISLQDLVNNLIGAWFQTIQPQDIDLTDRAVLFSEAAAVFTALLVVFYLLRLKPSETEDRSHWIKQALGLGLLASLLGSIPVWLTDRQAIYGLYSGRFALAAMFGLSLLLVALLEWFTPRRLPKILLIGVFIGASVGFQIRNATSFYRSSVTQNQFYWQLYWRAPNIKPGTALLSADELFPYVGRAATALAVNLLYPQESTSRSLGYWFLELYHDVGPKETARLPRGKTLNPNFRIFSFNGSSLNSLLLYYKTGAGRCLWVLSPDDLDNGDLPELTKVALPVSNLSRIEPQSSQPGYRPPEEIFGKEPEHNWCYYFQKASLAQQMNDWNTVAKLGDEAQRIGFSPGNAYEWAPFIEGYAYSGQLKKALDRTQKAFQMNEAAAPMLCRTWAQIQSRITVPEGTQIDIDSLRNTLQCTAAAGQ